MQVEALFVGAIGPRDNMGRSQQSRFIDPRQRTATTPVVHQGVAKDILADALNCGCELVADLALVAEAAKEEDAPAAPAIPSISNGRPEAVDGRTFPKSTARNGSISSSHGRRCCPGR